MSNVLSGLIALALLLVWLGLLRRLIQTLKTGVNEGLSHQATIRRDKSPFSYWFWVAIAGILLVGIATFAVGYATEALGFVA